MPEYILSFIRTRASSPLLTHWAFLVVDLH